MTLVRTLLADDHTVVRAGLRNALEVLPEIEIVGEVGDGLKLLDAIARMSIDLLVMDVSMPDFDPISAVRQIREKHPSIKILVVSAYNDESYVVGLLKAGANGYHLKDQPLADLQLAAQRVLSGERWISGKLIDRLLSHQGTVQQADVPYLTRRQRELLRLISQGADNRNIAQALDLSVKTVENHLTALYRVLGVDSRLKALNYILRHPELLATTGHEMAETREPAKGGHELIILIVDDNARYRQQLGRLVGKVYPSAILYEAENINEALSLSKQTQPQLAFVDVVLNDEDGIQCARKLKVVSPLTRVVVISAYPDKEFRRQALSAGVVAFLDKKDLDTASMQQVVEDALR